MIFKIKKMDSTVEPGNEGANYDKFKLRLAIRDKEIL